MMTTKTPKSAKHYECNLCVFNCSKKGDFYRHLSTRKHKMMTNDDTFTPKSAESYICNNCNKCYKYRQGLSLHKKTCNIANECNNNKITNIETNKITNDNLILMLINQCVSLLHSALKDSQIVFGVLWVACIFISPHRRPL